jgi:hypothetical protein
MIRLKIVGILTIILVVSFSVVKAGSFIAYSMNEAERRLVGRKHVDNELTELGGITNLAGVVYDQQNKDLIIVGQTNELSSRITLDDFVVALRAILLHNEHPLVSIDRTKDTPKTGRQRVRFEGKVDNTQFGKDMLEADVLLKKLSFGILPSEPWGGQSYFSMSLDQLKQLMVDSFQVLPLAKMEDAKYYFAMSAAPLQSAVLDSQSGIQVSKSTPAQLPQAMVDYFRIGSRFWFCPLNPSLLVREGVFAIQELGVVCSTEVLYAFADGKPEDDLSRTRDEVGDRFATQASINFGELRKAYPEIGRVKTLYDLVALAKGIEGLPLRPDLHYWLNDYKVSYVFTDTTYDLIVGVLNVVGLDIDQKQSRIRPLLLEISGGIELNPFVGRLKAGDVSALREGVLNAKPKKPNILTWQVPLEGWEIPGAGKYYDIPEADSIRLRQKAGFSLDVKVITTGTSKYNTEELVTPYLNPSPAGMPNFKINGVYIAPVPKSEGKPRSGLWENFLKNVLMSRPSPDTPFWEIEKIPGTEE